MLLGEIFQVALQAIRANKLRSFLTMLGIVIGVFAVIAMVAVGQGAQAVVQNAFSSMGSNMLVAMSGASKQIMASMKPFRFEGLNGGGG